MLDRRTVLKNGAASAALAIGTPVLAKAAAAVAAANPEAAKMNAMFDAFMGEVVRSGAGIRHQSRHR